MNDLERKVMSKVGILEKAAIKAANTSDGTWMPYFFDKVSNGIIVKGCSTTLYQRGARKGQVKFLPKQNPITVLVTRQMIEFEQQLREQDHE